MKLYNQLSDLDKESFLNFFEDWENFGDQTSITIEDAQNLDDFLANQGFELRIDEDKEPYWVYFYETEDRELGNGDYIVIYLTDSGDWNLGYLKFNPDKRIDKYFNNINKLINFIEEW